MLGSNLELTAYVMLTQFSEKCIVFICNKIIVSYTTTDKDLFHFGKIAELSEKLYIILVADFCIGANRGVKALPVTAGALLKLLFAGRCTEICRRSAYIVNISLEILVPYKLLRFCDN